MTQKRTKRNKPSKKQRLMSDNISKDVIFIIKRARYVYVRDFKYTVCLSEYLSIFFVYNEITCFVLFLQF